MNMTSSFTKYQFYEIVIVKTINVRWGENYEQSQFNKYNT